MFKMIKSSARETDVQAYDRETWGKCQTMPPHMSQHLGCMRIRMTHSIGKSIWVCGHLK